MRRIRLHRASAKGTSVGSQLILAAQLLLLPLGIGQAHAENLRISGRVEGASLWTGKRIYVQASREFPGAGSVEASDRVLVGPGGRFTLKPKGAGNYWLVAYADDGDGVLVLGKDVVGFARENPIPLGNGRSSYQGSLRLDPLFIEIWTRFVPAAGGQPAQHRLERLRIVPMHPRTGSFLADAEVYLQGRRLTRSPEGVWFGDGSPAAGGGRTGGGPNQAAEGRYIIEVRHPVFGSAGERRVVAPRVFGAAPTVDRTAQGLEWNVPSWANFQQVIVTGPEGKTLFEGAAASPLPLDKWPKGSKVRVRLGRADVQHPGDITVAFGESVAN